MDELHLTIKVIPNAPRTEIVGIMADGVLKIKVSAPPQKGKANQELIKFLEELFGVKRGNVIFVTGETARLKKIRVVGKTPADLQRIIK